MYAIIIAAGAVMHMFLQPSPVDRWIASWNVFGSPIIQNAFIMLMNIVLSILMG